MGHLEDIRIHNVCYSTIFIIKIRQMPGSR